jgi:hypothetical protein
MLGRNERRRIEKARRILLKEKRQKNNPNLLALFAYYRGLIIIGSVWG